MDITTYSTYILMAVAWLFPLLSNFVSRQHWPQEVTGILTLVISTLAGFVSEWFQDPSHFHIGSATFKALLAYGIAAFAHTKIWSGTDTNAKTLAWPRRVPPGGIQPGHEPHALSDTGEVGILLVVLIVLALLLFGLGFTVHALWWLLIVVVVIWLASVLVGRR